MTERPLELLHAIAGRTLASGRASARRSTPSSPNAAFTINSENRDDWEEITSAIERDEVDLLLVSPERFNNPAFRSDVLPTLVLRA